MNRHLKAALESGADNSAWLTCARYIHDYSQLRTEYVNKMSAFYFADYDAKFFTCPDVHDHSKVGKNPPVRGLSQLKTSQCPQREK